MGKWLLRCGIDVERRLIDAEAVSGTRVIAELLGS
jgi:hypothetical protein